MSPVSSAWGRKPSSQASRSARSSTGGPLVGSASAGTVASVAATGAGGTTMGTGAGVTAASWAEAEPGPAASSHTHSIMDIMRIDGSPAARRYRTVLVGCRLSWFGANDPNPRIVHQCHKSRPAQSGRLGPFPALVPRGDDDPVRDRYVPHLFQETPQG